MKRNLGLYFVVSADYDERIKVAGADDAQNEANSWSNPKSVEWMKNEGVDVSNAEGLASFWGEFAELLEKHGMGQRVTPLPTANEVAKNIKSCWAFMDAGMVEALSPQIADGKYDAEVDSVVVKNIIEVSNGRVNPATVEYAARLGNAQTAINYKKKHPNNLPVRGNSCVYIEGFRWDAKSKRFQVEYGT